MIFKHRNKLWLALTALAVLIIISLALYFALSRDEVRHQRGAVVANGKECALIGRDILLMGGSAADAAIATLFCEGVTCPQSMGLGGGFIATIYTRQNGQVETLTAREMAPLAATRDMFRNRSSLAGGLSVAVPGELRGYWALHQKYGKLPWRTLVEPSIYLCRQGFTVSEYLNRALRGREEQIRSNPTMHETYINPRTGRVWNRGDRITHPKLADTLEIIAKDGERAMYDGGVLGKLLAHDIQKLGGIITEDDFREYQVRWEPPVMTNIYGGHTLFTTQVPSSGPVLAFILNLVTELVTSNRLLFWHRIVESFKHGYAARSNLGDTYYVSGIDDFIANLSDPNYAKYIRTLVYDDRTFNDPAYYGANFSFVEDHGTGNMAVLAPNGDAITVTSTINDIFGAKFMSAHTGIVLNDEMDDFSQPNKTNGFGIRGSPANYIYPRKIPMSSMCPTIIVDGYGNVRLLIGAAGGSKITTSVAQVIIRHLIMDEPLETAVQQSRVHHQVSPMLLNYEHNFDKNIIEFLRSRGHEVYGAGEGAGFSAVTAIGNLSGNPKPIYDIRRNGSAAIV